MKLKLIKITLLLGVLQLNILVIQEAHAQHKEVTKSVLAKFHRITVDRFYWNGEEYALYRSPLIFFKGYKTIYPQVHNYEISFGPGGPIEVDKNYSVNWAIVDNMLYLCDIDFTYFEFKEDIPKIFPGNEQYKIMEELTGINFRILWVFTKIGTPISSFGVIPALWMNGALYVKDMYKSERDYSQWLDAPVKKLVFKQGELISVDEVSEIDPQDRIKPDSSASSRR